MKTKDESDYISEVVKSNISNVALRADGILHIDIKADELFNESDYRDLMKAALQIGNGRKFLNLITVGKDTTVDHEGRVLSTGDEGRIYKSADAFVIQSFTQKLIGNFYMNFHKPKVPTRFFNNVDEALNWLKSLPEYKTYKASALSSF